MPQRPVTRALLLSLLVAIATLSRSLAAAEPDYRSFEEPPPESVLDIYSTFGKPGKERETPVTTLGNFLWNEASLVLKPRSYYLDSQRDSSADRQAWAAGGALEYRTGLYRDRLSVGASVFTSQKLYGPSDKDGTLLLKPGQNGFTVLGEIYAEARLARHADLRVYRQSLNVPYLNRQDSRMAPNTFQAYTVTSAEDPRFKYIAGHVTHMKRRNATSFRHMSEIAGADDTDKGLSTLGALYAPVENFSIGAINHHAWDVFNTLYAEGTWAREITPEVAVRVTGQFTDQRSIGDELIGDFETGMAGIKLQASYRNAILTLARTTVDNDAPMINPYGGYPGFASVIVQDFNRAGEDAWLVGLNYEFSRLGLRGLSAFANFVDGDTPDNGSAASPDQQELDFTVDYRFQDRLLEGLWIRARAAFVDQDGRGANDINDYRLIVNYSIPLK